MAKPRAYSLHPIVGGLELDRQRLRVSSNRRRALWLHGKGKGCRRRGLRYAQLVLISPDRSRANAHLLHTLRALRDDAEGRTA